MARRKSDQEKGKSPKQSARTTKARKISSKSLEKASTSAKFEVQDQEGIPSQHLTQKDLHAIIAKRAYELYERRGWLHGQDFSDWLEAEQEILKKKDFVHT